MNYKIAGVQYYTKDEKEGTLLHVLFPIHNNGEGFKCEKIWLNGNRKEFKHNDTVTLVFDMGYNGKPYVKDVKKIN